MAPLSRQRSRIRICAADQDSDAIAISDDADPVDSLSPGAPMTTATPASATAQPRPLRRFGRSMRAIHDIRIANGTVNCSSKVDVLAGSRLRPSASRQLCTLPPSAAISIIQRNGVVLRGASGVTARAMIAYTMAMNSSGGNAATNGFIEREADAPDQLDQDGEGDVLRGHEALEAGKVVATMPRSSTLCKQRTLSTLSTGVRRCSRQRRRTRVADRFPSWGGSFSLSAE